MAHHVIVEFNLDKAHVFRENPQKFPKDLYLALAHSYPNNKAVLSQYGIRVLNEHHSGDCKAQAIARVPELVEVLELAYANLGIKGEHTFGYVHNQIKQVLNKIEGKE